jgi:metallo-beta-lactamase class B
MTRLRAAMCIGVLAVAAVGVLAQQRGGAAQAPGPTITVDGYTFTQLSLFQRNVGGPDEQTTQFPPHKIIGNLYYVGTASLSSFLVTTPQGDILINTTYERNVPVIQKSVEQLGFKFSDIKIVLGSHAHGDHMEGDALVKQLTGAQVMAMAEDVPALQAMKPGGKEHPVDRVLHDGDTVTLGGMTLTAHLTPGHTRGCTTWTFKVNENGRSYDVMIIGSLGVNPGVRLVNNAAVPDIVQEFERAFRVSRSLPCDVPLGSHPGMYRMKEKYDVWKANQDAWAKMPPITESTPPVMIHGGFYDPAGCKTELDIDEAMFRAVLEQQQAAVPQAPR